MIRFNKQFQHLGTGFVVLAALFFIFVATDNVLAQPEQDQRRTSLSVGSVFSSNLSGFGEELPFWLHANRSGLYDQQSANALLYTDFSHSFVDGKNFNVTTSGRLTGRWAENDHVGINMLSLKANYGIVTAQVGKFLDPIGMNYHPLSSGAMTYGQNAEPVPKIALKTDGFVDIPLAQGYLQFSSYFSHGWFEEARYVKNAYLHQKYLYLKINYKMLEGIGGIIHNVQWAGTSQTHGELPDSFDSFLRMVFARGAKESTQAPGGEQSNALGNSVAAYDFNLRINLDDYRLTFYRLFYLEDKVSTRFRSPWDGMWGGGIIFKDNTPPVKAILYEHLNTKRQDSFDFEPRGSAGYYNNFVYRSGWTYKNRVLGNPLILTDGSDNRPIYNNIIVAHHIGANGYVAPNLEWKMYYTFSRNYGVAEDQIIQRLESGAPIRAILRPLEGLKKINHSLFAGIDYRPAQSDRITFKLGVSADLGELYRDRAGVMAGISYEILP